MSKEILARNMSKEVQSQVHSCNTGSKPAITNDGSTIKTKQKKNETINNNMVILMKNFICRLQPMSSSPFFRHSVNPVSMQNVSSTN